MQRQKLRRTLIFIVFLGFPVILNFLSPYLIVVGALQGILVGSAFTFATLFLLSLFFGRTFCGWVCPGGGAQECIQMIREKPVKIGWTDWIKWIAVWIPWMSVIVIGFLNAGGILEINYLFHTESGVSIDRPWKFGIYYGILTLILGLAFAFGRRGFCHYSCWITPFMILGRKVSNFLHIPALRLKVEKDKCINCKICTKNCQMSLPVMELVQKGTIEHSECILCGMCIDKCPKDVIKFTFSSKS